MTIGTDFDALIAKAARLTQAELPDADRQRQRQQIATAAYEGNAEQRAAMRAAQKSGDTEAIAIEARMGLERVAAALQAFDAVFGVSGAADAQGPSGGPLAKAGGVVI